VSSIEIARPPEEVFRYITDPSRFTEWQADVVHVRVNGNTLTTTRRIGRFARTMTQEVIEFDPPERWSVRGTDGPLRPSMTVTVEPLDGEQRSRVTFELDFEGRGFADLLVPAIRRMAAKGAPASYRQLKENLEKL
jgi:uncharacterized protein YndB with AHSA1/START domain